MDSYRKKGYLFARYLWLYGEIANKGPITFDRINEDWIKARLNEDHEPLPHKTFENHRKGIEEMFNISVECDRSNNTYYIDCDSSLDYSSATLEMLNGALLFNRIQSDSSIGKFIRTEPHGKDSFLLFAILDALEDNRALILLYRHNYDIGRETEYIVKPIAVKQFKRRWYLISELEDHSVYSFSLDRIIKIEAGRRIEPSEVNVDELFTHAFGIIREKGIGAETISLKVEKEQANYFISRPLHPSQKIISRGDNFVVMEVRLCPTYDFIMEILSHGPKVEITAPLSLRKHMAKMTQAMNNKYKNNSHD
ncbi:MAG: WYL domain-containing protein [Muribaculaceae bacterium]|nr:WYL domain-containing protein [Muribaculaceae bacterium]